MGIILSSCLWDFIKNRRKALDYTIPTLNLLAANGLPLAGFFLLLINEKAKRQSHPFPKNKKIAQHRYTGRL